MNENHSKKGCRASGKLPRPSKVDQPDEVNSLSFKISTDLKPDLEITNDEIQNSIMEYNNHLFCNL